MLVEEKSSGKIVGLGSRFFLLKNKNKTIYKDCWEQKEGFLSLTIIAMEYTHQCAYCGTPCKNTLCSDCERKKHTASALVSQNVTKLKKLFEKPRFTRLWLSKFILYTNRIVYNLNELLKYKKAIEEIAIQIQ